MYCVNAQRTKKRKERGKALQAWNLHVRCLILIFYIRLKSQHRPWVVAETWKFSMSRAGAGAGQAQPLTNLGMFLMSITVRSISKSDIVVHASQHSKVPHFGTWLSSSITAKSEVCMKTCMHACTYMLYFRRRCPHANCVVAGAQ